MRLPSPELTYWQEYDRLFPFDRTNLQLARLTQTLVNIHRKQHEPYPIEDFLAAWTPPRRKTSSPEEMMAWFEANASKKST